MPRTYIEVVKLDIIANIGSVFPRLFHVNSLGRQLGKMCILRQVDYQVAPSELLNCNQFSIWRLKKRSKKTEQKILKSPDNKSNDIVVVPDIFCCPPS